MSKRRAEAMSTSSNRMQLLETSKELLSEVPDEHRAAIRKMLRDLEARATSNEGQMKKADDPMYDQIFAKMEEIHRNVVHTSEATISYQLLELLSEYGKIQASSMRQNMSTIDAFSFLDACLIFRSGDKPFRRDEEDGGGFDWSVFGKASAHMYRSVPSTSFMFGPLEYEPKPKAARAVAKRKEKEELGPATQVEQIDPSKEERTMTEQRVKHVKQELKLCATKTGKPPSFFDFTFNPESFTQTVENIFDFSFLLRDGTARIEVDPKTHCTGVAQAQPVLPDQDGAPAGRKQCIFKLDFNSYKRACEALELQKSLLGTRDV